MDRGTLVAWSDKSSLQGLSPLQGQLASNHTYALKKRQIGPVATPERVPNGPPKIKWAPNILGPQSAPICAVYKL